MEIGELLAYGVERVPLLYDAIRNDTFVTEPNALKGFTPSQQETSDVKVAVQRPSLFDFSRDDQEVRTPALKPRRPIRRLEEY